MRGRWLFSLVSLLLGVAALLTLPGQALAGAGFGQSTDLSGATKYVPTYYANSPAGIWTDWLGNTHDSGTALRKFVDTLPPLGCGTTNDLGQCLPVAEANTPYLIGGNDPYPGSDYYEIAIVEFRERMHQDLPATGTKIRGYVQLVPSTYNSPVTGAAVALTVANGLTQDVMVPDANGNPVQAYGATKPHYLGPIIVAQKGTPVRIKYYNLLPTGHAATPGDISGDLFIPVDHTLMGAGKGPLQTTADPNADTYYTENRTAVHFHGGDTPWISDGTPNQWLVPKGENTPYLTGASLGSVPDMPIPGAGDGWGTLYYVNDLSGRLMFYHDHAVGITRLNVYAGMAAGYEIQDPSERSLTSATGTVPVYEEIPLVVQDKTFVPKDIGLNGVNGSTTLPTGDPIDLAACVNPTNIASIDSQDCKWDGPQWGGYGDLWYPNVYEFNQDLNSFDGTNPVGRWDYGPYFWPIFPVAADKAGFLTSADSGTQTGDKVSTTPEAFGDTPVINGTAYPTTTVQPKAYRFRILNASNDKFFNLGLYVATNTLQSCTVTNGGTGYSSNTTVTFSGGHGMVNGVTVPNAMDATGTVTVDGAGAVTGINLTTFGSTYDTATQPTITFTDPTNPAATGATASCTFSGLTEMAMVPFNSSGTFPSTGGFIGTGWGTPDQRVGGIPSPATAGPDIIAIGSEGGLLPQPVTIPTTPINYEYNKRSVTVLNVFEHGLYLAPAERTDIIVDFSQYAGQTLILYNDAPSPVPAGDPRIDYYTGNPDFTDSGGAPTTQPGFGPNTRTMMQIKVAGNIGDVNPAMSTTNLATDLASAYAATQPRPIVWEPQYADAFPELPKTVDPNSSATSWPTADKFASIRTGSLLVPTFNFIAGSTISYYPYEPFTLPITTPPTLATTRITVHAGDEAQMPVQNKAIQELFDPWGRMNATLGAELPFTNSNNQTTVPLGYTDPVEINPDGTIKTASLEMIEDGETQIWKITHNGVDTHPVHIHLVNLQLINRVGWDGTIKPPDANELGWKETIKMNPLEDVIVAVRADAPKLPFGLPESERYISPSEPPGSTNGFTGFDPLTGNGWATPPKNSVVWMGWEYVWHCHILGHEENDFMRPFIFKYPAQVPGNPIVLTGVASAGPQIDLSWTDPTPVNLVTHAGFGDYGAEIGFRVERSENGGPFTAIANVLANVTSYNDASVTSGSTYDYRVYAYNVAGEAVSNTFSPGAINVVRAPGWLMVPASDSDGTYLLNWAPVSSPAGVTYHILESKNGGGFAEVFAGTTTSVQLTGRTSGTYTYRVYASATGLLDSSVTNGTNPCVVSLTLPTLGWLVVPATDSDGTYALNWSASSVSGVTYHILESKDGGAFAEVFAGTGTSVTLTGRASGTYTYQVYVSKIGWADSSLRNGTNPCVVGLSLPTVGWLLVPTADSDGTYILNWSPSTVSGVTYHILESKDGGAFAEVFAGTGTSVTLTGKTSGTYTYQVYVSKTGWVDSVPRNGNASCVVTLVLPSPGWLLVPANDPDGNYYLNWAPVNTPTGVTYHLLESKDGGAFVEINTGTTTSFRVAGRTTGSYQYQVYVSKTGWTDSAAKNGNNTCVVP